MTGFSRNPIMSSYNIRSYDIIRSYNFMLRKGFIKSSQTGINENENIPVPTLNLRAFLSFLREFSIFESKTVPSSNFPEIIVKYVKIEELLNVGISPFKCPCVFNHVAELRKRRDSRTLITTIIVW